MPAGKAADRQALERAQAKAAELVLGDEAWRSALEDAAASRLLNEALAQLDADLARAQASGGLTEDLPYELAEQARARLAEQARRA